MMRVYGKSDIHQVAYLIIQWSNEALHILSFIHLLPHLSIVKSNLPEVHCKSTLKQHLCASNLDPNPNPPRLLSLESEFILIFLNLNPAALIPNPDSNPTQNNGNHSY